MGRVKKLKKKVDYSKTNPLESVTIGIVKPPRFVLFKTILLIGLFGAVIYFMPEVKEHLDKYVLPLIGMGTTSSTTTNTNTTTNTTTEDDKDKKEEPTADPDIHKFGETTEVDLSKEYTILINNINLSETNDLSFTINATKTEYNLDNTNLFFIVYNDDDYALAYYKLTGTVSTSTPLNKIYSSKEGTKFAIKYLEEKDYPVYEMLYDDNNMGEVICTKTNEEYKYTFEDSILNKVEFKSSFSESANNYNSLKDMYTKLKLNYEGTIGFTASYDVNNSVTTFKLSVDYKKAEKEITTGKFFTKEAKYNTVLFEMEADQYSCTITDLTPKKTN